ncbi:MAG TPA: MerR family transcriptional regulator [Burkholderiaceae bacterium]|jgi:DNA-binding transcriptional MerR regulator
MKIGELALKSGVTSSAIRFYERSGLLPSAERGSNGYRVYGEDALERLRQITLGQSLGFTLDAMRSVYASTGGFSKDELLSRLDTRLDEIDQLQAALRSQSKELRGLRETLKSHWDDGLCAEVKAVAKKAEKAGGVRR